MLKFTLYLGENHMSRGHIYLNFLFIMFFHYAKYQKDILTIDDVIDIQKNDFWSTLKCPNL
jgi:hypothetical protein